MHQAMSLGGRLALAAGMSGAGALCIVFASLDPHWQRPPPDLNTALLAYANGAILFAASAALVTQKTAKYGGYALAAFLLLWIVGFNIPRVLAGAEAAWLAPAEVLAVACGAWLATGAEQGKRIVQVLFGLCCITFGVAHFLYLEFTASMIPAFIPFHMAFAASPAPATSRRASASFPAFSAGSVQRCSRSCSRASCSYCTSRV
jgi:hypothetical protein